MFSIRRANSDDLQLLVEFQMNMAVESEGIHLNENTIRLGVTAVLQNKVAAEYWLVASHDGPVGMMMVVPEWSDWRNGTVLWMHSVYVVPEWRKCGAFASMFDHLKSQVNQNVELVGLRLYVDKRNYPAQEVYKRLGMSSDHYDLYELMK